MRHLTATAVLALALGAPALAAFDPILLAQDQRAVDSAVLKRSARVGAEPLRLAALLAMGRIQSPAYADSLVAALADPGVRIRERAAFALGQLALAEAPADDPGAAEQAAQLRGRAAKALRPLLKARDPGLRAVAVEALGKAGGPGTEDLLLAAFPDADPAVRGETALALFRLRYLKRIPEYSTGTVRGLIAACRDAHAGVRWRAVYALSRWPETRAAAALSAAAGDEDLWTRLFAVRGLGQLKKAAPLDPLLKAQKDPDAMVRREAVAALGAGGRAGLLDESVFHDPSAHVRAAAAAAIAVSPDPKLAARLDALDSESAPLVRGEAILALAKMSPDASAALSRERTFPHWWVRSRAYLAMAELPRSRADLMEGLKDPDPRVAAAALESLAKSSDAAVVPALDAVLRDPQSSLEARGTAADAAGERKDPALLEGLYAAFLNSRGPEWEELRDSVRKAIAAIQSQPGYAGREYLLSEPAPAQDPVSPWLAEHPAPASVLLQTEKGDIEVALAVAEAPIHAAAFLHNVSTGLYDGLSWHRVVSNFVIQGGDPRGSGWGDAGFFLRDEVNRLRFERGAVGMPKGGKDTGGCQLFITQVPTPHLDGRYTVFGRVTRGMDVVDRIEPGDRILRALALPAQQP